MPRNGPVEDGRPALRLAPAAETGVEVVRYEERVDVGTERVPVRRVRVVKHVVTERRVVEVRREELRIEEEEIPVDAGAPPGALRVARDGPLELVLSEEEVVLTRTVVPRERVRIWVEQVTGQQRMDVPVSHEEIEVDVEA